MRLLASALLLSLLSLPAYASVFNWRVPQGSIASLSIPSPAETEKYLRGSWGLEEEEMHVCSAALIDVAKDGYYRLIASVDSSGRRFCNEVIVMRKPDHDLHTQTFSVWQVEDVADVLIDLDRDGIPELILPEPIGEYRGAETCGVWRRIYQWKEDNYIDASEKFPDFYEKRYNLLKSILGTAARKQCVTQEIDKIVRFLHYKSPAM